MEWFRWYTGCATDPKFQVVAKRSGQTVAAVLAVWAMLLERACSAPERGEVAGFDCEGADVLLGLDDGASETIYETMKSRGLIEQGRIGKWETRQPKREREDNSSERVRKFRERRKGECNDNTENETPCNAKQHQETPRLEEIRLESKNIPATSETDVPEAAVCSEREGENPPPITANQTAEPRQKTGRPNACPPETWAHYLKISRGFHTDKSNQLGARAPFTDEKVLSGARALDTLIRVRGRPEDEVLAVLGWSIDDPFWSTNLRSIKALLKTSNGNGELKYSNVLTAMTRDLERKAERSMAANG